MKSNQEQEILAYLLPHLTLSNQHPLLPGASTSEGMASFIGLTAERYELKAKELKEQSRTAALEILKDAEIVDALETLPFKQEEHLVVIGDDTVSEIGGWVDMLIDVLDIATELDLTIENLGVAGSTSVDTLRQLGNHVLARKPDWVCVGLGLNDALRLNYASNRPLISVTEFWDNIQSIEEGIRSVTRKPTIWMSPYPVHSESMEENPIVNAHIDTTEFHQYLEILRGKQGIHIDPYAQRLGAAPELWNYAANGFHLSIAGNVETCKRVIKTLAKKETKK